MGLRVELRQDGAVLDDATVTSDPVVDPEEGPVPRYMDTGVASAVATVHPGTVEIQIDGAPEADVWLLPGMDAVWSLHASGQLSFVSLRGQ